MVKKNDVVCELKENNRNRAKFVCSNETNEKRNPILFVVKDGKQSVGYRYTEPDVNLWQIRRWLKSYKINHIVVIDWKDRTLFSDVDDEKGLVRHISLKRFISTYFSEEIYDTYIKKIRCAVEEANKIIGFQTIEHLSLRQLSYLKEDVLRYLLDFKFRIEQYQDFNDEGKMTGVLYELLSDEDYDIIQKNCFDSGLYKALAGKEKFARCFLTSEYLYKIFESGDEKYFDYSTIVSGYFKSVELLLEKIMLSTFNIENHETLWIQCRINHDKDENHKKNLVRFLENLKKEFSTEMGPLINFLQYNNDGWYISNQKCSKAGEKNGKEKVLHCLRNYNKGCRNEHLHKHIIDDIKSVKAVRNNTILCLLYLLGSCKIYGLSDGIENMGIEDDAFEKLYRALNKVPRSINKFYLQFEDKEIKALRVVEQEIPAYDERGNIVTPICFVKVEDFDLDLDKMVLQNPISKEKLLMLTRENIPKHVFWCDWQRKKVEVVF